MLSCGHLVGTKIAIAFELKLCQILAGEWKEKQKVIKVQILL